MHRLEVDHLSNRALIAEFDALVAGNHMSFAALLTRIAEIDERRLYLEEGYPSMSAFLMRRMRLPTQSSAYKRLTAARTARKYAGVLVAVSDGRLNLTAVLMLAPHLTPSNADALVSAALDKTCFELQVVLAERFPRPDLPERLSPIAAPEPPPIPQQRWTYSPQSEWKQLSPINLSMGMASRRHHSPQSESKDRDLGWCRSRRDASASSAPWMKRPRICGSTRRRCSATRFPPERWPWSSKPF